jgi:methylated-DNA-protein-cysteine methyltransferase-like protein
MAPALPALHRRIIDAIAAIPRGKVASYGQIAALAGAKGRARLVGWVLRHTPDGTDLPWFRVMRAGGRIAFPHGSAPYDEQVRRLKREGVVVDRGRVDLAKHGWRRDLDEVLWGPDAFGPPRRRRKAS